MYLAKSNSGFSFIEVLVSLILIGVGLMGLGSMQITSLKGTTNAHSRTIATMLAMDLGDRMRANQLGVQGGFYGDAISCAAADEATACRGTNICTPEETATFDLQEVACGIKGESNKYGGVANLLPSGSLSVTCPAGCNAANAVHDINVNWAERNVHKDEANDTKTMGLTMSILPN